MNYLFKKQIKNIKMKIRVLLSVISLVPYLAFAQSADKNGFYKDVFMDSGIKLYDRTTLAAVDSLNLSMEVFLAKKNDGNDTLMQHRCFAGWEQDSNGALLYPDGSPRFRVLYVNGGLAGSHGRSLGEECREAVRKYVAA